MITARRLLLGAPRNFRHNLQMFHSGVRHCRPDKDVKDFYDPPYLETLKPKFPLYERLNIQIRGYDFPRVESFQGFVHRLAVDMELEVADAWATPAQELEVSRLKPSSDKIDTIYKLSLYHRTVQLINVPSVHFETLLRLLEVTLPAGLTIDIVPHEDIHQEIRYVPDTDLIRIRKELEELGGPLPIEKKEMEIGKKKKK